MQVFGSPGIPAKDMQAPSPVQGPAPVHPAPLSPRGQITAGSAGQTWLKPDSREAASPRNQGAPPSGEPGRAALARMSDADMAQHLENLRLPVSRGNLALARRMMECGLPVTGLEFQGLKKALASLPRTTPEDLTSAVFLKYSGLPLTGENITTLASFIRNRPLLGSQVLELQQTLRNLLNNGKPELSPQMFNTLERLRELLDGFMLDPGRGSRRELSDSLFRTAGRSLVEKPTGGGNGDETSLASLREQLGRGADLQEGTTLATVFKLLGELGKNLSAQGLLNQARDGDNPGFFYFQVPLRLDDEGRTGELRVRYRRDSEESRRVDPDDARVEFTVETEHLGKLEYMMEMTRGRLAVQVGVASREKKDFVQNRLHFLKDRLESLGCEPGLMVCRVNPAPVKREGIPVKIFESSERVNVTA